MIKLAIFDFDGTMADTADIILNTMRNTIARMQLPARSDAECAAVIGLPLAEGMKILCNLEDQNEIDEAVALYRKIFAELDIEGAVTLFDGVMETIQELVARGIIVTIASSRGRGTLINYVHNLGLDSYISLILGVDDVIRAKPDPYPVEFTMEKFGISADETIVVGDAPYDILMGTRAGTHTIAVTYGNGTIKSLKEAGAEHIIDHFSTISEIISRY
jgi:phosphoglycolate phosphatase